MIISQIRKEIKITSKKFFLSWLWVILCSVSIFLIIPVARTIQKFVSEKWSREVFGYFVLVTLAIGFVGLLYSLIFRLNIRAPSNYVWLILVMGAYVYFTLKLWKAPEEAVHFLEYGLLGFFLFNALRLHIKDKSIYLTATLFALFIGTFDEMLQWITPRRVWAFRDVGLNALSGGLFQLALWKVVKPKIISEKINTQSLKIFSSILAFCLIFLGLCASNTPQRVASYTKKIPWLSYLQKEEPMGEFGYKYTDPEIGTFYSRFSPEDLSKTDNLRGNQCAQILNESINRDYEEFIREYSPATDPFLHELRVHIFRRDTYLSKGKSASYRNRKKNLYFISYKENLILEKYFSQSIEKSVYRWNKSTLQEIEALLDKSKSYKSPVSANLLTTFSEKTMWVSIFGLILFLVIVNLFFHLRKKRKKRGQSLFS